MAWILLIVAGLLEVAWATVLPTTEGFSKVGPTAGFFALLAGSMLLLAKAAESLPIGTAYAVWVGIGAVGTALVGILVRHEPATFGRIGFLTLLIVSIVGLKVVSGEH